MSQHNHLVVAESLGFDSVGAMFSSLGDAFAWSSIRMAERAERLEAWLAAHPETGFMANMRAHNSDWSCVVAPCVKPGRAGQWQASFFDAEGPWGDIVDDYPALCKRLSLEYGVTFEPDEMTLVAVVERNAVALDCVREAVSQ